MSSRATQRERQKLKAKQQYLIAYNTLSAVLWAAVLGRVLLLIPMVGFANVYGGVGEFTKWTQTLAVMEIVHALLGIVRTPIVTTGFQVLSRLNLVWPILHLCPNSMRSSPAYSTMLIAWSITEIIRYSYYALNLQGDPPAWLTQLRYNTFFVLYPVGISSECWELYGSLSELEAISSPLALLEKLILYVTYPPVSYMLYTHMMTQRRKMLRGKKPMRT